MTNDRLLLAFDTSTTVGSVALGRGARVLARAFLLERREHAASLIPAIESVLDRAQTQRTELDGIVVGKGPGSFTGVRIAAATARGLSAGLDVPIWLHSSLAAGAVSDGADLPDEVLSAMDPQSRSTRASGESAPLPVRCTLFDARGQRVYAACFRIAPGRLEILMPPAATEVGRLLTEWRFPRASFCGDGAWRHRARIEAEGHSVAEPPLGLPTGEGLLRLHALNGASTSAAEGRWEPEYLRESSARPAGVPTGSER